MTRSDGKRVVNRPVPAKAGSDRGAINSDSATPLLQRHRPILKGQAKIVATVVLLLLIAGPFAIAAFVMTSGVYALKCQPRWARSHITKELGKVARPLFRHSNATAAVALKSRVSGFKASLFRVFPRSVLFTDQVSSRMSMDHVSLGQYFSSKTATAASVVTSQMIDLHYHGVATLAGATPHNATATVVCSVDDSEPCESLACQIA